ncbi:MAG TPA: HDOD domain-containing protein [Methylibium sp.]|uniref:HDOD domain-containing protein n=1 Tax=Methylibium sp. TaxID=2067992 RepID=UPI002DB8850A|nr:HDOD domain-containing protein [Methylibium sp.]HEU4459457.1 HDOD domain-containing protein [Methylibium sp.]
MAIDQTLRALDIDLPACPQVLVQLSVLMHDEGANLRIIAELIETDMALASAVVRTVNSAYFGLQRRVESVPEAVRYLGTREVSALTFEIGLRGAFPPRPMLNALWERAGRRGLAMGRAAPALDLDPWLAHTAGLFAESGQAALVMHDTEGYEALLASTPDAFAQLEGETALYGVNHAALGAALCQVWGLSSQVAAAVRLRPAVLQSLADAGQSKHPDTDAPWLTEPLGTQQLLALGAIVDAGLAGCDEPTIARYSAAVGPVAGLDAGALREAALAGVARVQAG